MAGGVTYMGYLAIIWHSRTGASRALAEAVETGAIEADASDAGAGEQGQGEAGSRATAVRRIAAEQVEPGDLLGAQGYVFVAPENLGTLSGVMKDMFDRTYYPLLGQIEGRPYASVIAAGSDGTGAAGQVDRIVTGWRLRRVAERMIVVTGAQTAAEIAAPKRLDRAVLDEAAALGRAMAEGLALGIF
ncbi:flavodoxin family protein [Novosphingobium sp. 1949]|uniref:Flavodoxin family protein n=1 Tax=Novosphingobium organovorum TaxID=2930092 RepID=A0ABT0BA43_9SPHN|nr:flavodoxin family protein [Novosphingobium organovorum]MCJ2181696.1 flavodoxin family protein [Novosphingobium organovorum]